MRIYPYNFFLVHNQSLLFICFAYLNPSWFNHNDCNIDILAVVNLSDIAWEEIELITTDFVYDTFESKFGFQLDSLPVSVAQVRQSSKVTDTLQCHLKNLVQQHAEITKRLSVAEVSFGLFHSRKRQHYCFLITLRAAKKRLHKCACLNCE